MKTVEMNQQNDNEQLVQQELIEGTPFTLVNHDTQYFIALGQYRVTPPTTKEEALKTVQDLSWFNLINIMSIVAQETYKNLNHEKETKTKTNGQNKSN